MSDASAPKRPRGRPKGSGTGPVLPPEERTKPRSVRLNDARWERLKALGSDWLAGAIDAAADPAPTHSGGDSQA